MRLECGPISDAELHQKCLQSFAKSSPYGTNTPTYARSGANYGSTGGASYGSAAGGTSSGNPGMTGSGDSGAAR